MENHYTLFQLNEHIRRVLALNLPEALWISCELAQVSQSKGHVFLQLVEKAEEIVGDLFQQGGDTTIVARAEAVIWAMDYRRLRRKIGVKLDQLLQPGLQVLIQAKVDFHERYGLKLVIQDIDPDYTIGKLAQKREQTIDRLRKEGLFEKNKALRLPSVLQRIAVLSSATAAGYQDYLSHLQQNSYAYSIENQLFPTAMQGERVEAEMIAQLRKIEKSRQDFDAVVIIRGGGAKLDLLAFDELKLSRAIANCALPVLSGIGHDIDETVVDLVAHTALKTPTAVADFILQHNLHFEMQLSELGLLIQNRSLQLLKEEEFTLEKLENQLSYKTKNLINQQNRLLEYIETEIPRLMASRLKTESVTINNLEKMLTLLSPETILKRGFSLSLVNGQPVTSLKNIKSGDQLETILAEGRIFSEVLKKEKNG